MFDGSLMDKILMKLPMAVDGQSSVESAQTAHMLSLARRAPLPLASTVTKATGQEMLQGRLLYVEDNVRIAEITEMMLEDLGLQVIWAASAEEALQRLDGMLEPFDLVFTDVVMPGMSGVELARRIREHWPDIPVLLTSGFSHELALGLGSEYELLPKPFTRLALIQCLLQYLPPAD